MASSDLHVLELRQQPVLERSLVLFWEQHRECRKQFAPSLKAPESAVMDE